MTRWFLFIFWVLFVFLLFDVVRFYHLFFVISGWIRWNHHLVRSPLFLRPSVNVAKDEVPRHNTWHNLLIRRKESVWIRLAGLQTSLHHFLLSSSYSRVVPLSLVGAFRTRPTLLRLLVSFLQNWDFSSGICSACLLSLTANRSKVFHCLHSAHRNRWFFCFLSPVSVHNNQFKSIGWCDSTPVSGC